MNDKITALYTRVSTDQQREKGESIANQKSRLLEYSNSHGCNSRLYEDAGFSAKDTNRPSIRRLLDDVRNDKVKLVLVTKVDRITRRMKDLLDLLELFEKHNVGFKSLTQPIDTSSAMGRGFLNMLGVFAEMERGMVSERVGEDMRHRAKNGKWNGGVVPYGYTSFVLEEKKLIKSGLSKEKATAKASTITPEKKCLYLNSDEADVIKKIYTRYISVESLRNVTMWLNDSGFRTRNHQTWAPVSVRRILGNPTYIGKTWYNKRASSKTTGVIKNRPRDEWIEVEGNHPHIIDPRTFKIVKDILDRQSNEPRRKMSDYLLSGLVRCGKCGGSLNGYTLRRITKKSPRLYSYYKCHNYLSKGKASCAGVSIPTDILEGLVVETILKLSDSKKFKVDIKRALKKYNEEVTTKTKPMRAEKDKLIKRNDEIDRRKKKALILLEDNAIDKLTYKARLEELGDELDANQNRIYEIEHSLNDSNIDTISFNAVYDSVKNFRDGWGHLDKVSKKDLLWSLVSKIVVKGEEIQVDLFFLSSFFDKFDTTRLPMRVQSYNNIPAQLIYSIHIPYTKAPLFRFV